MDKPSPFDKVSTYSMGTKFADMTRLQKFVFVGKVLICVATFGFAFPNVQSS
jgi:hypothetical protein